MRDLMPISLGRACRLLWMYAVSMLLCILGLAGLWAQEPSQRSQPQVPDTNEPNAKPVHDQKSTQEVVEKLKKAFDSKNAAYAGSNIQPVIDDQSVTLNGTVKSEMQHEMTLQVARAYAGNRKIVDRLSVRP